MKKIIVIFVALLALSSNSFAKDWSEKQINLKEEIIEGINSFHQYTCTVKESGTIEIHWSDEKFYLVMSPLEESFLLVSLYQAFRVDPNDKKYVTAGFITNRIAKAAKVYINKDVMYIKSESVVSNSQNFYETFEQNVNLVYSAQIKLLKAVEDLQKK